MATSLRVYTGAGAVTESAAVSGFDLISADNAVNSSGNRTANKVAPGSNSYEKYVRIKIDDAEDMAFTGFWVERTGTLPEGVSIRFGVTDAPATPVATTSLTATRDFATGRKWYFDAGVYASDGATTRYLVFQEQVAAGAASGNITAQSIRFGWSAS